MKIRWINRLSAMLLIGALAVMVPKLALASTPPCTLVSNTAKVFYTVGGVDLTGGAGLESSAATFNVGVKVIVSVTNNDGNEVTVTPSTTTTYALKFTVRNDGNAVHDYDLSAIAAVNDGSVASPYDGNNDTFDGTTIAIYPDAGTDGIFVSGVDDAVAAITTLTDVPADGGEVVVFIVYSPTDLAEDNLETAVYHLQATSKWNDDSVITYGAVSDTITPTAAQAGGTCDGTVAVDVVAGDTATAGTLAADIANDGTHSDDGAYEVSSAAISIAKAVTTIWDPVYQNTNSPAAAIPGALVQYVLTIANAAGAESAVLTTITDALIGTLAMDPDLKVAGAATTIAALVNANAAGDGFMAKIINSTRTSSGVGLANNTDTYYTTADDGDGIDLNVATIEADLALVLAADTGGGTPYVDGELKGGETLTITFNAIIQ